MAAPSPGECLERHRLFVAFKAANQLLNEIHESEIQALLADDLATFKGFQPQLEKARENRSTVAEALLRHMQEHAC